MILIIPLLRHKRPFLSFRKYTVLLRNRDNWIGSDLKFRIVSYLLLLRYDTKRLNFINILLSYIINY